MDKNVGSVNLDELKEAREALNKEMGIETDPNMYSGYDPEKHKAEREQSQNGSSESDDETISFDADEVDSNLNSEKDDDTIIIDEAEQNNDAETELEADESKTETDDVEDNKVNFDVYDSFADFEVTADSPNNNEPDGNESSTQDTSDTEIAEPEKQELDVETADPKSNVDSDSLDNFLDKLDNILLNDENNTDEENNESIGGEEKDESISDEENVNSNEFETDELDKNLKKYSVEKEESVENDGYNTEILTDFSKLSELSNEISAETEKSKKTATDTESEESETSAESEDEETASDKKSKNKKPENEFYKAIEPFKFIDIMATEEFKDTDNFSYLLGKNEDGNLVFGNIKDTCGTAYFTRSQENVFSGFSSILISLLLKNSPDNMQFVVCDAMFDSDFDVFENSSYMYFNRVAKNNREIVDTLLELSKEIETRYNNLVFAGVKSIGAYNMQAEERGTEKMPYIVLFLNNYAKMAQFLDNERINTCLYNILKFGRIAGVYVMLASAGEIERNEINFNLPTRVAYKTDDELESVTALGFKGAENLTDDQDFLYSTVFDEKFTHLKVASLTKKEVELIIENLEN